MKTLSQVLKTKDKPSPSSPVEPDSVTSYTPKTKDEKRFMDKHVVKKTEDANGNKDDVFRATNIKSYDRDERGHGYNSPDDQKVYESRTLSQILGEKTLTSAERKKREEVAQAIERDQPGMPKFKKMAIATATAKRVAEDVEYVSIEEEVKTTDKDPLVTVHMGKSLHTHANLSVANSIHSTKVQAADVLKGPVTAGKYTFALSKHHETEKKKDAMKEEVEHIAELSKKTLGKYVKAAAKDAEEAGRDQEYHGHKNDYARGEKRQKGIEKAVDRLTKEEVELEEAARNWTVHTSTGKHQVYGPSGKGEMEAHLHRQMGGAGKDYYGKVHKMEPDDTPSGATYSHGRRYMHGRQDSNEQVQSDDAFSVFAEDIQPVIRSVFNSLNEKNQQAMLEMIEAEDYDTVVDIVREITNA